MATTATCPSLEELAAFLDGRLTGKERARVVEHLVDCESCYAVFAEAARFQQDSAPAAEGAIPFPFEGKESGLTRRRLARRWLPLAATALLAVAVGIPAYRSFFAEPPPLTVAELVEPLEGKAELDEQLWGWSGYRGAKGEDDPGEIEHDDHKRQSFLVGAWLVDRRVALTTGEPERAADLSRRISVALDKVGFMDEAAKAFEKDWVQAGEIEKVERSKRDLARAAFLRELRKSAAEREAWLSDEEKSILFREYLDLGKWTEAGRLAAVARSSDFFERRANRSFPVSFLREERDVLQRDEPTVTRALREIQRIWEDGELQESDYRALKQQFGTILKAYDPDSRAPEEILQQDTARTP